MSMSSRKYNLYGQDSERRAKTEYEVVTLPLQKYVSSVRKFVSEAWKNVKVAKENIGSVEFDGWLD